MEEQMIHVRVNYMTSHDITSKHMIHPPQNTEVIDIQPRVYFLLMFQAWILWFQRLDLLYCRSPDSVYSFALHFGNLTCQRSFPQTTHNTTVDVIICLSWDLYTPENTLENPNFQ